MFRNTKLNNKHNKRQFCICTFSQCDFATGWRLAFWSLYNWKSAFRICLSAKRINHFQHRSEYLAENLNFSQNWAYVKSAGAGSCSKLSSTLRATVRSLHKCRNIKTEIKIGTEIKNPKPVLFRHCSFVFGFR